MSSPISEFDPVTQTELEAAASVKIYGGSRDREGLSAGL